MINQIKKSAMNFFVEAHKRSGLIVRVMALVLLVYVISMTADSFFIIGVLISLITHALFWFVTLFLATILVTFLILTIPLLEALILWNPEVDSIGYMMSDFVQLLVPVYVIGLILIGIYILFFSTSAQNRAEAKSLLLKIILSMIMVSLSVDIFKLLLGISKGLAMRILSGTMKSALPLSILKSVLLTDPLTIMLLLIITIIVVIFACIAAAMRYVLVVIACAFFPFTLFLYFFGMTKETGRRFLRYSLLAIFTQPIQALMLGITITAINSKAADPNIIAGAMYLLLLMGGLIMVPLAPLIMLGILNWIGGIVASTGLVVSFINPAVGGAMVGVGNMMAGMGPGGLMAGSTAYMFGKTHADMLEKMRQPPKPVSTKKTP